MFKKVFYNTGAQIVGKAATASITLLVTFIITRTLGPAGYGDFTKIFVFVGYFYTLADFGLNAIYVKLATQKTHVRLLSILFGLRLIIALILASWAILISFLLPYNSVANTGFSPLVKTGILVASLTIIPQALFTTANAYYQKNLRYDLSTLAAIGGSLVILISSLFVAFSKFGLLGYVASYVFGGAAFIIIAYWLIFQRTKKVILPQFVKEESIQITKHAWPIGLALIFNLIYFRIDVFILANFRSSAEVGIYGLAYQFFEAALSIPIFFTNAIYPLLTSLYQSSQLEFKKQSMGWSKILIAASVCLLSFLVFISLLIPAVFGKQFSAATRALQILALGMPFFFISSLLWHLLIIYGKQKLLIYIYATGALFNLVANLIFIPVYGYLAASIITVVSEGLITLLLAIAIRSQILDLKYQKSK